VVLSVQEVRALLEAENEMRCSAGIQAKYAEAEKSVETDWMQVTDVARRELLAQRGLPATEASVQMLQRAAQSFPEIPLYVRHNRCRQGSLAVGGAVPNVPLVEVHAEGTQQQGLVEDLCRPGVPLVLVAGSFS
jgi:hypothetical protein